MLRELFINLALYDGRGVAWGNVKELYQRFAQPVQGRSLAMADMSPRKSPIALAAGPSAQFVH